MSFRDFERFHDVVVGGRGWRVVVVSGMSGGFGRKDTSVLSVRYQTRRLCGRVRTGGVPEVTTLYPATGEVSILSRDGVKEF